MENHLFLVGTLQDDPQLSFAGSEKTPVARFVIVVRREWNDRQTAKPKSALARYPVVCYGPVAQNTASSARKDDVLIVVGKSTMKLDHFEILADHVGIDFCYVAIPFDDVSE